MLSTPAREFPDFPAALSLVAGAEPDEVRALLESRVQALEVRLAELERPVPHLPRLFLLESEYMAAIVRAEIQWLRAVNADLRSGTTHLERSMAPPDRRRMGRRRQGRTCGALTRGVGCPSLETDSRRRQGPSGETDDDAGSSPSGKNERNRLTALLTFRGVHFWCLVVGAI